MEIKFQTTLHIEQKGRDVVPIRGIFQPIAAFKVGTDMWGIEIIGAHAIFVRKPSGEYFKIDINELVPPIVLAILETELKECKKK